MVGFGYLDQQKTAPFAGFTLFRSVFLLLLALSLPSITQFYLLLLIVQGFFMISGSLRIPLPVLQTNHGININKYNPLFPWM